MPERGLFLQRPQWNQLARRQGNVLAWGMGEPQRKGLTSYFSFLIYNTLMETLLISFIIKVPYGLTYPLKINIYL